MNPANSLIVKCPHCGGKKELLQLLSGNTFGAQLWSDAKQIAPMLPRISPVQKCPDCGHYFLMSRIGDNEKSTGDNYSFETGWLNFQEAIEANKEIQLLNEIEQSTLGLVTAWAYNDIVRNGQEPTQEQQTTYSNYIQVLLSVPGMFADNELLRAELYREIGDFNQCTAILEKISFEDDFMKNIAEQIAEKAKSMDCKVFKIY